MSKWAKLFVGAMLGVSVAYDFYRGYHQTHSISDGIVFVVFGLIVLASFWRLYRLPKFLTFHHEFFFLDKCGGTA